MLADHLRLVVEDKVDMGRPSLDLLRAVEVIDWWRDEHAKPLSRVAANLRYYVAEEGKPVCGPAFEEIPNGGQQALA